MTLRHKLVLAIVVILSVFALMIGIAFFSQPEKRVLSETTLANVDVDVTVYNCQLQFTVYPEKRIPATNNWATNLSMEILNLSNTSLGSFSAVTNNAGVATVNICDEGIFLTAGNYNYKIKGESYLQKRFDNYPGYSAGLTIVDFSGAGELKVGDNREGGDNKVNSLDLTAQVKNIYSTDYKNDFNKDGVVNALDISTLLANFYITGDN